MKVKLGKYTKWWGPYQIADLVFGNPPTVIDPSDETWRHRGSSALGSWLANIDWFADLCEWIHERRKRMVYVKIDYWDTWSMDDTLRHIIGPMLVQLRATKQGSGFVDDEDVPPELRSTAPGARDGCENEWDTDMHFHRRYDWMLDELIWAFTTDHEAAKEGFYNWSEVDKSDSVSKQIKNLKVDREAVEAYDARLQKAYCLFGKYYQTLWD